MLDFTEIDLTATIRDLDYTRRAVQHMNGVIESSDFEDMDARMILDYLTKNMVLISFKDQLKRYIYNVAEFDCSFSEVEDKEYLEIISDAFNEHVAPASFTPTSRSKAAIYKSFLKVNAVKRSTIFVLGFGLGMMEDEVSEFLTKVCLEEDYNFNDSWETICWYCLKNQLSYFKAQQLKEKFEKMEIPDRLEEKRWKDIRINPRLFILNEDALLTYLTYLKKFADNPSADSRVYETFMSLYDRARAAIIHWYEKNPDLNQKVYTSPEQLGAADVEKVLGSGSRLTKNGNLEKMSRSLLKDQFRSTRVTRQRIDYILSKKRKAERFDLISMLFLVYAIEVEPNWPTERYLQYITEMNKILNGCGMAGLYPVNPYEAFVLMCLISDDPLAVYAEVFEMSFEEAI